MKTSLFLFISLILLKSVHCQSIENTINLYGTNFPQEKIHIHFDKDVYLPGETIWFKAYVFEEDVPSARSTNFYASLYDDQGKLIQQALCPILGSTADGHFQIPDSLSSKQLICRAYTTWMMNFDSTLIFTKAIRLINNDATSDSINPAKTVSLQFFPEGGDIIEGCRNTIAFKANYNNGLPFEINGVLKKQETGEVIMPLQSVHDGMGRFDVEVQPNEKYYAEWINDKGIKQTTYLPMAKPTGISLKLIIQKNNLIFNIVNKLPSDSLHVLMYMYQKVFYTTDLSVPASEPFTGIVPVNTLPTGTMQLTVFDASWQPIAERIAFINNGNYSLDATVTNKDISTEKRGKNTIEIELADTIAANLSLSITDAALNNEETGSSIVTDLLLSGDVKGYICNPAYYFTNNTDAALKSNLDLVMLTHGWRRYNWDNVLAGKMPAINYPSDDYLGIYGQVGKTAMQKKDTAEIVNLIVKSKDSTQHFYFARPDATGLIKQTGLIFYDSAKVLYSFNKNKLLNPQLAFSTLNFTYPQPAAISNYSSYFFPDTSGTKFNQLASTFQYYIRDKNQQEFNKEKTLQAVIVKSGGWHNWKNDPLYKMDQKYTDGVFRSWGGYGVDVLHDEMAEAKFDVYNYMMGKVPVVYTDFKGGKHFLTTDKKGLILLIDEREVENDQIALLDLYNIAYIKFLDVYPLKLGFPHALCFYTKKGDDLIDRRPKDTDLKFVKIAGYSHLKEFYSPDYSQNNTTIGTDARTTLLWQPYILTDAANRKIPVTFYNNDFSKKFRLVIEGINDAGKMVHIDKIIE